MSAIFKRKTGGLFAIKYMQYGLKDKSYRLSDNHGLVYWVHRGGLWGGVKVYTRGPGFFELRKIKSTRWFEITGAFTSFPLMSPFPIHSTVTLSLLSFSEVTIAWCVCPVAVSQTRGSTNITARAVQLHNDWIIWIRHSGDRQRVKLTIAALYLHVSSHNNLSKTRRHSPRSARLLLRPLVLKQLPLHWGWHTGLVIFLL